MSLFGFLHRNNSPAQDDGGTKSGSSSIDVSSLGRFGSCSAQITADVRDVMLIGALDDRASLLPHKVTPLYSIPDSPNVVVVGTAPADGPTITLQGVLSKRELRRGESGSASVIMLDQAQPVKPESVVWADKRGLHNDSTTIALPKIESVRELLEDEIQNALISGNISKAKETTWLLLATSSERTLFCYAVLAATDLHGGNMDDYDGMLSMGASKIVEGIKAERGAEWTRLSKAERLQIESSAQVRFGDQVEYYLGLIGNHGQKSPE